MCILIIGLIKVAWNIHPSDSILQGLDTIVCLLTGHGKSPIFKCIPRVVYVPNKDCKRRKETNISRPNCISAFISNKGTSEELLRK